MISSFFRRIRRFNQTVLSESIGEAISVEVAPFDSRRDYTREVEEERVLLRLGSISAETSRRLGNIPYVPLLNCVSWNWLNLERGVRSFANRNGMTEVCNGRSLASSFGNENTVVCLTENGSLIGLLPSGPDLYYECISLRPDFLANEHRKLKQSTCFENIRIYSNIRRFAPLSTSAMLTSPIVRIYWKSGLHRNTLERMKDMAFCLRAQAEESAKAIVPDAA